MTNNQNPKFDLEERTTEFAKGVIRLCRTLSKDAMNNRLVGQIVGSAGSIGANYREANDALGKKDFIHRLKISHKEANPESKDRMGGLMKDAIELKNILSSIIIKSQ